MTQNEIWRTSFKYMPQSNLGVLTGLDSNRVCPYCKNQNTETIRDPAKLKPFKDYYGEKWFRVVDCFACGAVFSYVKVEAI